MSIPCISVTAQQFSSEGYLICDVTLLHCYIATLLHCGAAMQHPLSSIEETWSCRTAIDFIVYIMVLRRGCSGC